MWVIGKLRGSSFSLLAESPIFQSEFEAARWARDWLEANPSAIQAGLQSLTWRWEPEALNA